MSSISIAGQVPFGLLEIDASGTVLYSNIEKPSRASAANLAGMNLDEVLCCNNGAEFRQHLDRFRQSDQGADGFNFVCHFADGSTTPVRVLLARMRERTNYALTKSILVHIRKAI